MHSRGIRSGLRRPQDPATAIRRQTIQARDKQRPASLNILRWIAIPLGLFAFLNAAASVLFDSNPVLDVTLSGPFGSLLEHRDSLESKPFILKVEGKTHDIQIRLRGHSRRRVCDFPPLRLKFPATGTEQTVFAGQRNIKLVTHCKNYDRGEQDLLEEYLAYRILNIVTDISLRVRLLRLNYQDSDGQLPEKATNRYGFVIEPVAEFATRIGATAVTLRGVPKARQDLDQAALIYVFQYLIANTDWALTKADYEEGCCHNIELFRLHGQIMLVPYDFDLAGLVNAQYAFPDVRLRIKSVTRRLYRGVCTDREVLRRAIRRFNATHDDISTIVRTIPGLTSKNIETAERFLNSFFERAEDEDKMLRSFERRCI